MIFNRELLRKYFIMGSQNCHRDPNAVLEEALAAGITAFQFREKGTGSLSGEKKLQLGRELRERCRAHDVPFFINDDIELAEELEVDGIHVGQDDMPVKEVRTRFSDKIIGLSISTQEELDRSPLELVDYIGVGPIFTTSTKEDSKQTVGLEWIHTIRAQFPDIPIVAIGGIQTENAHSAIEAGADGVSFITAVTEADDIKEAADKL
ncbi:thiamine-phosphate synthase [Oceanobacillus oncorhynchi subsp. incaldanensis]|uniref:thiamine phosphate synthase n=1 Tax=Oceanobacillus oncorhynchi TaxID=545501 RepID=UPI001B093D4D|nr:thiamine phosphate synthase [Oceanobacillus oncorhynchi]GIO18755.1 thiamine-phosphate synthase [Oceanobacillus oncorhynchi subsp. incaldanensis]